jgi:hypothetical protein
VDDRTLIAAMALQGLLTNGEQPERGEDPFMTLTYAAARYADALIAELHNVPAPSGGPVASPPGSDSPHGGAGFTEGAAPSTREGNQSLGSPAGVRASARVRAESELPRSGAGRFPAAPIGQKNQASAHAYPTNGRVNPASPVISGAASLHAGEDAAAQGAPPGDLALPPSATAGENPARPVSNKSEAGDRCEKCNAVLVASNMCVACGHVHGVPEVPEVNRPRCKATTRRGWSCPAFVNNGLEYCYGHSAQRIRELEAVLAGPSREGQFEKPPPARAEPARDRSSPGPSPSRKAKPGTPCGGPSCRDSITTWIHDPRTCPLYRGNAFKGAARGCSEEKS